MEEYKILLQLFADDEGSGAEGDNGDGAGTDGKESKTVTFDEFLKGEGNQAEFDRRVNKAIQTAVSNAQKIRFLMLLRPQKIHLNK